MFTNYERPPTPSAPRFILAMNRAQILERVESGVTMMLAFRELIDFIGDQKGEHSPLVYSTFRRFVLRENAKTNVPLPMVVKAEDKPGSSSKKTTPPLPLRKPKIGPGGVDFSGTGTAEELFGPAPEKKSPNE